MLAKILAITTLSAFVLLSALLQSTSPSTIHPVGILAIFVLLYLLALGVLTFFIYGISLALRKIPALAKQRHLTFQQGYYYASVLALAPVMLIGMRSIGRAHLYDVILIILFEVVACFYISKRR